MLNFRTFIKLARPLQLLLAALTFSLGAGISRYLGHPVHVAAFGLGLLAVLAIEAAAYWLAEYFRLPLTPLAKDETPRHREALRTGLFQSAAALLTVTGAIIVTLLLARLLPLLAGILIGLIVVFFIAYAVPPMRLSEAGYGELAMAVALGTLFPALAFLLQYGEFHRLLTFVTFPLTLLALAFLLVNDFPTFATDLKFGRHTLLTRLTWQYAIPTHHWLILVSFLFFATAPWLGFPWGLVWPVFLALPFAVIQIIWLQRIALGGRTLWKFLTGLGAATFGLTAYLLAFTFWIR
jgi:1,4-dihydroxy-2-naphthoate octaprenyltransferase